MNTQCTLSVILITKNEAHNIRRCLESVKWANEIIILDSGSTDETPAIAKEYTDKVYLTDWPGFGKQKNRALDKASQDWILSIDADEWLSDELINEIQFTIKTASDFVFAIPRTNICWGRKVRFGDFGTDTVIRLFRRGYGRFSEDLVHESIQTNKPIKKLKCSINHFLSDSVEDLVERLNNYTSLAAEMHHARGKSSSLTKAIFHGIFAFLKTYIFRAGFLDGKLGFITAITIAENSYYKYIKILLKK